MTRASLGWVVMLVLPTAAGCRHHEPDACERAIARLQRIEASRSAPPPIHSDGRGLNPLLAQSPAERANLELDECRHGTYASYDPVLRCAMDSASDDGAAACIDRFLHDVVREPAAPAHP